MMYVVYISVILGFVLIMYRRSSLFRKMREERKKRVSRVPETPQACEVNLPCYKVLAFRSTDYISAYELARDVECKLVWFLREAIDEGAGVLDRLEYISFGNILLILVRFPDKKVSYPVAQKEGVKNEH